jgi:hypothetical protein
MLNKEFKYYIDNQGELLKSYKNRFIVITRGNVVGDYDTIDEAFFDAVKKYEPGTFIIQKCTEGDKDYTQMFHSRAIF